MRAWAPMPIFYITEGSTEYSHWKTEILADPVLVHKRHPKPHHLFVTLSRLQPLPHLHSPRALSCVLPPALHVFPMAGKRKDYILATHLLRQWRKFIQLPVKCSREPSLAITLRTTAEDSGKGTTRFPGTPAPA